MYLACYACVPTLTAAGWCLSMRSLINRQLYKKLAIACHTEPLRTVSLTLIAKELSAKPVERLIKQIVASPVRATRTMTKSFSSTMTDIRGSSRLSRSPSEPNTPSSIRSRSVNVMMESVVDKQPAQLVTISTGPLGMTLSNSLDGSAVAVTSVVVGSAAEAQGVRVGAFVLEVNGETTTALDKDAVVALIIAASRPLTLKLRPSSEKSRFQTPAGPSSSAAQSTELLVSFEAGPLGIGIATATATGLGYSRESFVVVSSVDDGSAAASKGVRVGWVLKEANGESLAGMDKAAVMKMIKTAGRPLTLKLRSSESEPCEEEDNRTSRSIWIGEEPSQGSRSSRRMSDGSSDGSSDGVASDGSLPCVVSTWVLTDL